MTNQERWQRDLAEIEIVLLALFFAAWVAFWWLVHHSYITL
jgi:hypothetical protein